MRISALAALCAAAGVAAQTSAIQFGDSHMDLSQQTLATFCASATTANWAQSGSTAEEWATSAKPCPVSDDTDADGDCNAAASFSALGTSFTHVVMTVGGNDLMNTGEA